MQIRHGQLAVFFFSFTIAQKRQAWTCILSITCVINARSKCQTPSASQTIDSDPSPLFLGLPVSDAISSQHDSLWGVTVSKPIDSLWLFFLFWNFRPIKRERERERLPSRLWSYLFRLFGHSALCRQYNLKAKKIKDWRWPKFDSWRKQPRVGVDQSLSGTIQTAFSSLCVCLFLSLFHVCMCVLAWTRRRRRRRRRRGRYTVNARRLLTYWSGHGVVFVDKRDERKGNRVYFVYSAGNTVALVAPHVPFLYFISWFDSLFVAVLADL